MRKVSKGRRDRATEIVKGKVEVHEERPGGGGIRQGARKAVVLEVQTSEQNAIGKVRGEATRQFVRVQAKGIKGVQEAKGIGRDRAIEGFSRKSKLGDTLRGGARDTFPRGADLGNRGKAPRLQGLGRFCNRLFEGEEGRSIRGNVGCIGKWRR